MNEIPLARRHRRAGTRPGRVHPGRLQSSLRPRRQSLLGALLLLAFTARAVVVTLTWTPIPQTCDNYRVYARAAELTTNWTTISNVFTWEIPEPGRYWFKVRAERTNGDLSGYSEEVTCEVLPTPEIHATPHVVLTVVMQTSPDLFTWSSLTSAPTWLPATNAAAFFRDPQLRIERARTP